ncbi:MAG: YigZ family protein [Clostridia bacterium]|nr:YigZ family protein [Clostridia bacterium]
MIEYKTLAKAGSDEIIIEKSRFIGYCAPVSSEEEALEFIEKIKKKHYDATHNVFAYVVGLDNNIQRYNDDGEPSGTAGVPILEVIKKEDLRNVVIVVTRYFGGIKLGTGGLIRAYTKGAKIALDAGIIIKKKLHKIFELEIAYTLLGKVENELNQHGYTIKEIIYDELVHIFIYVPIDEGERFIKHITQWTNARFKIAEKDTQYLTIKKSNQSFD